MAFRFDCIGRRGFDGIIAVLLRFMAIKKESVDTTVFHLYLSCTLFTVVVIIVETLYTHHSQLQTHIATNQWLFVAVMLLLLGGWAY